MMRVVINQEVRLANPYDCNGCPYILTGMAAMVTLSPNTGICNLGMGAIKVITREVEGGGLPIVAYSRPQACVNSFGLVGKGE